MVMFGTYTKLAGKLAKARLTRDLGLSPPLPWKLLVEITKVCNNSCLNCNIWSTPNKQFLGLDAYESLFKENKNLMWLSITGGEPFTRPDIDKIVWLAVKHCRDLRFLSIPTTGFATDTIIQKTKELMKTGLDIHITISLDGPREVHNQIRGTKDGYDRAIATFKALRELGVEVRYQSTVHKENFPIFREFYEKFKDDIGVLTFTQTSEAYYSNSGNIKPLEGNGPAELFEYLGNNFALRKKHDIFERMHLKIASKYLRKRDMMLPCTVGFSSCYISTEGDVLPCFLMPSWGNLKNESFSKIWHSQTAVQEREKIRKKQCPKCWINCFSFNDMLTYPEKAFAKAYF